mgnify:FL=1|jgi:hypothetical protein
MENVMFEKVPYGVKVRVRGNEQAGFIAEYVICPYRFLSFMDNWNLISRYTHTPFTKHGTFPTLELAKEAAMTKYDSLINHFRHDEEQKKIAEAQRKVVWKHP